MKRSYDSLNSAVEISSYRDQHFKVCFSLAFYQFLRQKPSNFINWGCKSQVYNDVKCLIHLTIVVETLHVQGSRTEQEKLLRASSTLYIGNLSFYTTEEQIYELFSQCGDIRRVIMGLDKYKKTPCGFCFVEYYTRLDSENCMR